MTQKVSQVSPKNIGRSNETTAEEQAIKEFESKIRKQYDKGYRESIEACQESRINLPMLASNGGDKPHLIKYPCDSSVKLDGVRCLATLVDGEVILTSRGGKPYQVPPYLDKPIRGAFEATGSDILDGELYHHGLPLQEIVSIVKKPKEDSLPIFFYVFDVPSDKSWLERKDILEKLAIALEEVEEGLYPIVHVPNVPCESEEEMIQLVQDAESLGFEGLICRNLEGLYEFNYRSLDLIKVKNMKDSEALVIGVTEDKNGEGVLECEWNGVTFGCKMVGTFENRNYLSQQALVGKYINFKYQTTTTEGKPQFPVGLYVREMTSEGVPSE